MTAELISRAEAKAQGLRFYFTGKPCQRGGVAQRWVSSKTCSCELCTAHFAAGKASNYKRNRLRIVNQMAVYRETRKDTKAVYDAAYRAANKERISAYMIEWQRDNPAKVNAISARRRAAKVNATPAWANMFFIEEAYDLARHRTELFGFPWHVDHIVPLQSPIVCGLHVEHNLAVIPGETNRAKSNRYWPDMP